MRKSLYCLFLIIFLTDVALSDETPDVHITIKTSGAVDPYLCDNWIGGYWFDYLWDIFTNRDHEYYPNINPTLGAGFIWDNIDNTQQFYAAPVLFVEIHAKDLEGVVPKEKLVIRRWILGSAAACWDIDDEIIDGLGYSFPTMFEADDDLSYFYDYGADDVINLDGPGFEIDLFQYAEKARLRINFYVVIQHADTGETLAQQIFKVQVQASWPASGWIQHTSTFLQVGASWTSSELDTDNW